MLHELIEAITAPDETVRAEVHRRWAAIAKPLGGLGRLETALEDIGALCGSAEIRLTRRALLVLCADNGVVAQGVTQTDSSVTAAVTRNLALGCSTVCRMAQTVSCSVIPVDMGVKDFPNTSGVRSHRIGNGTGDFTQGPAMTRAQAEKAIVTGIRLVQQQKEAGLHLLASGEMGIGNTSSTSAVVSVLLGKDPSEVTGRGAGLSDEGLCRKVWAVTEGLAQNHPDPDDPIDVLAKVGGFDLAGLCGVFLGGALYRIPVLIDGVISAAAALCAVRLCPIARYAMLASHCSSEPTGRMLLDALDKKPLITADMRLGEGTGAVAAIPLLDMALAVYHQANRFEESGIEAYRPQGSPSC